MPEKWILVISPSYFVESILHQYPPEGGIPFPIWPPFPAEDTTIQLVEP